MSSPSSSASPPTTSVTSAAAAAAADWATAFPEYSTTEKWGDAAVHVLGVGAALVAAPWLIANAWSHDQPGDLATLIVYVIGLLAMLSASALYNLMPPSRLKAVLRRVDHAMIFVMIAGSITPFAVKALDAGWAWVMLGSLWTTAIGGVVAKLWFPHRVERISLVLYLAMGWAVVAAVHPLIETLSTATLVLLAVGGVLYTAGTAFHMLERLRFHNVVWHVFVLIAAACHYAAVSVEFV